MVHLSRWILVWTLLLTDSGMAGGQDQRNDRFVSVPAKDYRVVRRQRRSLNLCGGELTNCRQELSEKQAVCNAVDTTPLEDSADAQGNLMTGPISRLISRVTQPLLDIFSGACSSRLELCQASIDALQCAPAPTLTPALIPNTTSPVTTGAPTTQPHAQPTSTPTSAPVDATTAPFFNILFSKTEPPTGAPTGAPVDTPTTNAPQRIPTTSSQVTTSAPTRELTAFPTQPPTRAPVRDPTAIPTKDPTNEPTREPTSLAPTKDPTREPVARDPLEYSGRNCNINGPNPAAGNVKMKFVAFGDTPYDQEEGPPFEGAEYACLQTSILPSIRQLANQADFAAHVGDIKRGGSSYSSYCNDQIFTSRRNLFSQLEPTIDFFLVVGDNEWNECDGYKSDADNDDRVKELWREYFTTGDFEGFDRNSIPSGESPSFRRQSGKPENFYMYYPDSNIAFFGITEPYGDRGYDEINANWIESSLSGKAVEAIIIFGHSSLPSATLRMLSQEFAGVPTLYVKGEDHEYCMRYLDEPNVLELTVAAYTSSSLLVSVVEDPANGDYLFHVESSRNGC